MGVRVDVGCGRLRVFGYYPLPYRPPPHPSHTLIIPYYGNKSIVRWSDQNDTKEVTIILNISCVGLTLNGNGSLFIADYKKTTK